MTISAWPCECGREFQSRGARANHARHCTVEQARSAVYVSAIERGEDLATAIADWRRAGRPVA